MDARCSDTARREAAAILAAIDRGWEALLASSPEVGQHPARKLLHEVYVQGFADGGLFEMVRGVSNTNG